MTSMIPHLSTPMADVCINHREGNVSTTSQVSAPMDQLSKNQCGFQILSHAVQMRLLLLKLLLSSLDGMMRNAVQFFILVLKENLHFRRKNLNRRKKRDQTTGVFPDALKHPQVKVVLIKMTTLRKQHCRKTGLWFSFPKVKIDDKGYAPN